MTRATLMRSSSLHIAKAFCAKALSFVMVRPKKLTVAAELLLLGRSEALESESSETVAGCKAVRVGS